MTEAQPATVLYFDRDATESAILPILRKDFTVRSVQAGGSIAEERVSIIATSPTIEAAASVVASQPGKVETLIVLAPPPPRADGALDATLTDLLRRVTVPTMLLFGTRDTVGPPQLGRLYRRVLPEARLMFVFDATADMANERPEAVAAILREFLIAKQRFVVTGKSGRLYP